MIFKKKMTFIPELEIYGKHKIQILMVLGFLNVLPFLIFGNNHNL